MSEFVDLEIHGPAEEAMGFVEGYRLALGAEDVFYAHREHVRSEGILDALASTMGRALHVLLDAELAAGIVKALAASPVVTLNADPPNVLNHAELAFSFHCFTREDAQAIRTLVQGNLPEGVVLEGFECHEKVTPDAKGDELYSPVHDYECEGKGLYHGPVPGVLLLSRRLTDQDFIHPRPVELVHPD